jgi:hypothetical protein
MAYSDLSAAYAQAGRLDEAKAALAEARRINPKLTIKWLKEHTAAGPAVFEGLRKAGAAGGMKRLYRRPAQAIRDGGRALH